MTDRICLRVSKEAAFWYASANASKYTISGQVSFVPIADSTVLELFTASHRADGFSGTTTSRIATTALPAFDTWTFFVRVLNWLHGFFHRLISSFPLAWRNLFSSVCWEIWSAFVSLADSLEVLPVSVVKWLISEAVEAMVSYSISSHKLTW